MLLPHEESLPDREKLRIASERWAEAKQIAKLRDPLRVAAEFVLAEAQLALLRDELQNWKKPGDGPQN